MWVGVSVRDPQKSPGSKYFHAGQADAICIKSYKIENNESPMYEICAYLKCGTLSCFVHNDREYCNDILKFILNKYALNGNAFINFDSIEEDFKKDRKLT